jgi:hypothetical protein
MFDLVADTFFYKFAFDGFFFPFILFNGFALETFVAVWFNRAIKVRHRVAPFLKILSFIWSFINEVGPFFHPPNGIFKAFLPFMMEA